MSSFTDLLKKQTDKKYPKPNNKNKINHNHKTPGNKIKQ